MIIVGYLPRRRGRRRNFDAKPSGRRDEKGTCGTYIRSEPHPDVTRSTRTDMTFVHLRSTKSREHMSRVTTPGLTARRVSPRVTHSFPPALAAMKKGRGRDEGKRVDVDALARETERENESHRPCETCPSRLNVVNTKVQLRHLIIGHIIFIHKRRTAAGNRAGGSGGPRGFAPVTSRVDRARRRRRGSKRSG